MFRITSEVEMLSLNSVKFDLNLVKSCLTYGSQESGER